MIKKLLVKNSISINELDTTDDYFVFDLADLIAAKVEIDDTRASVDRLETLPEKWRYIEPLVYYQNEVTNGGHHQYFWNSQGIYRHLVEQGLKYFRADGFSEIFAGALAIYRPENYEAGKGATYNAYNNAYEQDPFDKQDTIFFQSDRKLVGILADHIRTNRKRYS